MAVTGSAFLDFVIGFAVSLIASIMNAAGLNLLKLDHVRNSSLPMERQRNECGRPMWHIGLYLYIASQLAGSTIALNFLKTQWVAPLGSIALVFNFIFAKILVGTQITRKDVYGTIVVMLSVVWIVIFGGMNSGGDIEDTLTLTDLKALFAKTVFIIYFSILNTIIFAFLALGMYAYWAISLDDESGQLRKNMKTKLTKLLGTNRFARASGLTLNGDEGLEAEARDLRLKKVVAMIMSACGGLLASETLLLAKSGVKLITSTLAGQNQFTDNLSFFILFVLVFTAILQVYCLNTGLKLYDSVLVVPTFYGFYTAFGLINSAIYLDQLGSYEPWVLLLVLIGIGALIYGVKMLSAPKPEQTPSGDQMSSLDIAYDDDDENAHEMDLRSKGAKAGGVTGKIAPKMGRLSSKKKSITRRSRHGLGADEENDTPSMYGSHRGILDPDDISSETSSTVGGMGMRSVGGSSTRGRGMSFTSKSSFQSDPFRTPKDNRSINDGFRITPGSQRGSMRFEAHDEAPTHVLVDTTEDLNDSDDEGHDAREREGRRQSMLQSSLKILTMHENQGDAQSGQQQQRPRIDTATARAQRESARLSMSSGMMSPSQFKAHLMGTAQQPNQPNVQSEESDKVGAIPRSSTFTNTSTASITGMPKGHSARWSTGSSKVDQAFEDLNPFKILKSNRDSVGGGSGDIVTMRSLPSSVSASLPSSPRQPSSSTASTDQRPGQHGRQNSFTGLPSEWDVPERKKRHSMRFGETGRSNAASGAPLSTSTSPTASMGTTVAATTMAAEGTGPSPPTPTRTFSTGTFYVSPRSFSPGEKTVVQSAPLELEFAPSPRTSRIMSSPEIQLGPMFALAAAAASEEDCKGQ
ncbi:hypothetical protein BGZ54_001042 [Gamsiella multidivaricata]|nr:hypothetical protein BGZ54_001042 [Gamsiella multidivaricata]